MISGVNQYQIYASLFKNSFSQTGNPDANAIYSAGMTAMYSSRLNNKFKSELNQYMASFSNNTNKLQTASSNLLATNTTKQNNALDSKKVTTSNSNIVTATALQGAQKKNYQLAVNNKAEAQTNETQKFKTAAVNDFTTGTHSFKISTGGKTTNINVDVKTAQSNKDVLTDISNKINQANTGVVSTYKEDKNGNSYLQINAKDTGITNKFEITDINSDISQKVGLNNTTQAAQDAKYKVNDKEFTSSTNTIFIDNNKVEITIKAAGTTTLNVSTDTAKASSAIKQFVESYNDSLNSIKNYGKYASSNALQMASKLENAVKYNRGGLESIGISVNPNGTLRVDNERLDYALDNNIERVKSVLSKQRSVATEVNKVAKEALTRPLTDYVNNMQLPDINENNAASLYSYSNAAQKQYMMQSIQQGILFDMQT